MTRTPLKRFPLLRRKLGSVMSNYVQGTYNQALPVFFFCSCSDFPDSCSTPNKQKRKGSVLGLDPQDLNLKSPSKRACKKHSPLPAPAKQVKRCGKNSSEPHFFFFLYLSFFLHVWFACACTALNLKWCQLLLSIFHQSHGRLKSHLLIWGGELRSVPGFLWSWTKRTFFLMNLHLCFHRIPRLTRLYLLIWMGIASLGTLFPFLLLLQQNRLVQILCADLSFPVLCHSLCRELRTTTGSFASYACPKWNLCGMWVSVKISFSVTLQKNALLTRGGNSTVRVVCLMTITSLCLVRPFFVGCIIFLCRFSFTHPFPLLLQIWLVRLGLMSQKLQQWHICWKPPLPVSLKTLALTSFLFLTTGLFTLPDQGSSLLPTVLRISCC